MLTRLLTQPLQSSNRTGVGSQSRSKSRTVKRLYPGSGYLTMWHHGFWPMECPEGNVEKLFPTGNKLCKKLSMSSSYNRLGRWGHKVQQSLKRPAQMQKAKYWNSLHTFCGQFAWFWLRQIFKEPQATGNCGDHILPSISFHFLPPLVSDLFDELRVVCFSGPNLRRSHAYKPEKRCCTKQQDLARPLVRQLAVTGSHWQSDINMVLGNVLAGKFLLLQETERKTWQLGNAEV